MKVIKSLSLYPFLFIFYAVLAPLASNIDQIPASLAVRPLAVLLVAAAAGLFFIYILVRDWQYAAYLAFLILTLFFTFGHINRLAQGRLSFLDETHGELYFLIGWGLLLLLLGLKPVWATLGGRTWMIPFLNIVFLVALIQPAYRVMASIFPIQPTAKAAPISVQTGPGEFKLDCSSTPDIYYVILDAYGREDVLDTLYGIDTRPFLEYLRTKGFFVADKSHTNYTQTIFSLPASLNFSYIDPPSGSQNDGQYFFERIKENALMQLLKRCGYRVAVLHSGYYYSDHLDADLRLTGSGILNEFEDLLLSGSPAAVLADEFKLESPEQSYAAHRQRVLDGFNQLQWAYQIPGPKIVFAHIITPHPPFVFDASGNPIQPSWGYSMGDGDEFQGDVGEYRRGYAGQVQFADRELENAIDSLIANSKSPPVIILQGDHGPGSNLNWSSPDASCLWERTSIFNAYYLPNGGSDQLYPAISPVNSFRVVLNAYFGAGLPLLPDRTYFTSHRLIRQVIDVTEIVILTPIASRSD